MVFRKENMYTNAREADSVINKERWKQLYVAARTMRNRAVLQHLVPLIGVNELVNQAQAYTDKGLQIMSTVEGSPELFVRLPTGAEEAQKTVEIIPEACERPEAKMFVAARERPSGDLLPVRGLRNPNATEEISRDL
jgi:hypothetical protein